MKSRIIDEDYLHAELVHEYDKIIGDCMSYFYETAFANENVILLKFKDADSMDAQFLFKIARLCNTVTTIPIFLEMKFFEYHKFLRKNKTEYKTYRIGKNKKYIEINEDIIHNIIKEKYSEIYSKSIFELIYNEFWTKDEEIEESEEEIDV